VNTAAAAAITAEQAQDTPVLSYVVLSTKKSLFFQFLQLGPATAIKTFPQKKSHHQDISNAFSFSLHFVSASQFPNVLPYSRKKLHWEIDCDDYVLKRTNSI
jgi:hypothetical protein